MRLYKRIYYAGKDITDECKFIVKMSGVSTVLPDWVQQELAEDESKEKLLITKYEHAN